MNETMNHAVLEAIIATITESDPDFGERLAPRLETAAKRADVSGWKHEAAMVRKLIPNT